MTNRTTILEAVKKKAWLAKMGMIDTLAAIGETPDDIDYYMMLGVNYNLLMHNKSALWGNMTNNVRNWLKRNK